MTSNQIAYWNYHEGKRHSVATEKETHRHNKAMEGIERSKIDLGRDQLNETIAKNERDWVLGKAKQLTDEDYKNRTIVIQQATQSENARHNLAIEGIQGENVAVQREGLLIQEEKNAIAEQANALRQAELEFDQTRFGLTFARDTLFQGWDRYADYRKQKDQSAYNERREARENRDSLIKDASGVIATAGALLKVISALSGSPIP